MTDFDGKVDCAGWKIVRQKVTEFKHAGKPAADKACACNYTRRNNIEPRFTLNAGVKSCKFS